MIAVTKKQRTGGGAGVWCNGCYNARSTMRLEARPGRAEGLRTLHLCALCRIKMIRELEKTV